MTLFPLSRLALLGLSLAAASAQVPYERIRKADAEPGNWLTYSGNYHAHRHTLLSQITPANVGALKAAWVYQIRDPGKIETSPIVIDGVLYITEKSNVVTALDGRTGRPLWNYRRPMATDVAGCCGPVNRGLAVLDDALFLTTFDCYLVCLDLRTGKKRWEVKVADYKTGHSMTAAPLAVKDKIVVGISGGEYGIRGFLDAYDPKTGAQVWRFWTIPGKGEPGNDTWLGDSWKTGAGATWVTGAFDPELNTLYWGTGNPGPDYDGDVRLGDNLYTNCLVALDPDTGKLKWHFQYTPHDLHDWDSNQVPILIDAKFGGRDRKLVAQGNRNGFFYLLDRTNGEYLVGQPYIKQTWAKGLDEKGRPIRLPNTTPTPEGVLVFPGLVGGTNWFSPSYNPKIGLFYFQSVEDYAQVFYKLEVDYEPGKMFEGGGTRNVQGAEPHGAVKAIDPLTGKIKWEFRLHSAACSGVMSTVTGLVFGGDREGNFFALDGENGLPLWRFHTGGQIAANPISYAVDGKQYVAIAAGGGIFVFGL